MTFICSCSDCNRELAYKNTERFRDASFNQKFHELQTTKPQDHTLELALTGLRLTQKYDYSNPIQFFVYSLGLAPLIYRMCNKRQGPITQWTPYNIIFTYKFVTLNWGTGRMGLTDGP